MKWFWELCCAPDCDSSSRLEYYSIDPVELKNSSRIQCRSLCFREVVAWMCYVVYILLIFYTPQITYTLLTDSSGDHSLFRIDPELGIVYTEAVFDREARSSYLLEVQSEDGQESARPGKNKQPNSG